MKKMKSLSEFQSESVLSTLQAEAIQGGANPRTEYFEGTCTGNGSDCYNVGYYDDGSPSSYVGPEMPYC